MQLDEQTNEWFSTFREEWNRRTQAFEHPFDIFGRIPEIPSEALRNSRLYSNRYEAVLSLPKGKCVAEVGTFMGNFAKFLLHNLEPSSLHLFDLEFDTLQKHNSALQQDKRIIFHIGDSPTELSKLPASSLDIIYIDGDHTESGVRRDVNVAVEKLKSDGLLVFNDYVLWSPVEMIDYGVVHVVNGLLAFSGWSVVYFAFNTLMYCDIALTRAPASPSGGSL
jgi:hypothetical protein